ncbi:oligosaccharide flippase family protein [Treponema bryantii]|uniref:oligosaccharide flippase family protein n=1 Tax=Treponema bryantii TaxID=163 RepID=UPI002B2B7C1E|nr:flippase [Treponema bryantii]
MSDIRQKSLKKNALFSSIKSVMNIIFPIISFPYASRILLPEGIGSVNFANSIIEYFLLIADLGIGTYAAREAARIRDNKYELSKLTREILFFNFITTTIAYLLLIISLLFINRLSDYRLLLIICSTKILFSTIGIGWLYTAQEDYGYITIRHIAFQIISLILLFTLVKSKEDYLIYAGIGVFSNVGANIFNFIHSRKYINLREKTPIQLTRHIKPILTFFSVDAAGKVNGVLDTIMLGFLSGDLSVGLYIAATKLSKMVRQLITSIISTFMPRSSYLINHRESDEYESLLTKVLSITFFLSIPAAVGLLFLAEPLTIIFCGDNYLDSVPTMKLLAISIIFCSFNSYLNNLILTPNRLERFMLYAQLIALVINGGLNWILITYGLKYGIKWGVFGAGIATLLVDLTLPIVKLFAGWKYINNKKNFYDLLKALIGSALMLLVLYLIVSTITNITIKILISVITGSIVYAIIECLLRHSSALMILSMLKKHYKK